MKSAFFEQSAPVIEPLLDEFSTVYDVGFGDLDLDFWHMGGTVAWIPSADSSRVVRYFVYFAVASHGGVGRLQVGRSASAGNKNLMELPYNTLMPTIGSFLYVLVYTKSL